MPGPVTVTPAAAGNAYVDVGNLCANCALRVDAAGMGYSTYAQAPLAAGDFRLELIDPPSGNGTCNMTYTVRATSVRNFEGQLTLDPSWADSGPLRPTVISSPYVPESGSGDGSVCVGQVDVDNTLIITAKFVCGATTLQHQVQANVVGCPPARPAQAAAAAEGGGAERR